jgi:hypothetical protein
MVGTHRARKVASSQIGKVKRVETIDHKSNHGRGGWSFGSVSTPPQG